jgi:TATA-box binding protein (TBP) (component of TFIID and TFIIIB)
MAPLLSHLNSSFNKEKLNDEYKNILFKYKRKTPNFKFTDEVSKEIIALADNTKLPNKIKISTITISCKTSTQINIHNISRFIDLNMTRIMSVKYGKHPYNNRSLLPIKKKKRTNKKKKRNFYNECTVKIRPPTLDLINNPKNNPINVKIFKNGSLQMTGVKNMKNFIEVTEILFSELKIIKSVIYKGKLVLKPFVEDSSKLKLYSVQVCMINTNFKLLFQIDREQLYMKLLGDKVKCKFEPLTHACVNIKFQYNSKKQVSIFVFESGAIIITGANNVVQINAAYDFIMSKIKKYGSDIILNDIDAMFECKELKNFL